MLVLPFVLHPLMGIPKRISITELVTQLFFRKNGDVSIGLLLLVTIYMVGIIIPLSGRMPFLADGISFPHKKTRIRNSFSPFRKERPFDLSFPYALQAFYQYIPPIPPPMPPPAGASTLGSGLSATTDSVVKMTDAMEAAFCRAERVTLVGSTMPADIMST